MVDTKNLIALTTVWVKTAFVGFHHWPEAPAEVEYLSQPHRHLFKVSVEVKAQNDDNRTVEFHTLKKAIDKIIQESPYTFGIDLACRHSCETMSSFLAAQLFKAGYQVMHVSISEDGENGASIYFMKDEKNGLHS